MRGRRGKSTVAVLTIIDEEMEAAKEMFAAKTHIAASPYFCRELSQDKNYDVIVRKSTGRSNVPAQQAASDLLEDFRPQCVLLTGIAGGMGGRDDLREGDVVVPDYIHYGEFQKLVSGQALSRYLSYDHPSMYLHESYVSGVMCNDTWASKIPVSHPTAGSPKVLVGSLVAGEKVYGDPTSSEQVRLLDFFNDSLAVDMESMGVARAILGARRDPDYNAQYLTIRGISDLVDDTENNESRKLWKTYAAYAAAAFASALADEILAVSNARMEDE